MSPYFYTPLNEEELATFRGNIRSLSEKIIARVKEVGLKQATEEYEESSKAELRAWFAELDEYRARNGIPEDEL